MTQQENDFFLAGVIVTLSALKELKKDEDLNLIDFDYILQQKKRDLHDPAILNKIISIKEEISIEKMS